MNHIQSKAKLVHGSLLFDFLIFPMQQMEEIYFIFFISVLYNIQNPKSYLNYDQQEYNYFDKS